MSEKNTNFARKVYAPAKRNNKINNNDMKRILSLFFILMSTLSFAQRTNTRGYVTIELTPDHADWTYQTGENVQIQVTPKLHYVPMQNALVHYTWGPEIRPAEEEKDLSVGKNGSVSLKLRGSKVPGFKKLTVTTEYDGTKYTNTINIAFSPERIEPTAVMPHDFLDFWNNEIKRARKIALEPLFTLHPERCTGTYDVYEVRFQNTKKGEYLYGALCTPKGVNPADTAATRTYPVMIIWPGAGVKPHPGAPDYFLEKGIMTLEMGIHGIPVMERQEWYSALGQSALAGYPNIGMDDRSTYYYKKVFTGTVRTVDMLCEMACVDTTHIACFGGSQGGALSIVHAALDKRIRCTAVAYPAMCELAGEYRGRVGGWPHFWTGGKPDYKQLMKQDGYRSALALEAVQEQRVRTLDYYDVVNFARLITCPVWFQIGFNDHVCCPTSTFSAYNVLTAEKELFTPLDCGHWQYPEHRQKRANWLIEHLIK